MASSFKKKSFIYQKTNGICIICNHHITHDPVQWSLEHYIPRAIYKWLPNQELESKIESFANLFIVHHDCNFKKDCALPNLRKINELKLNDNIKNELLNLYASVSDSVAQYTAIKQSTWDSQHRKCYFCHRNTEFNFATLRRINNTLPRIRSNAMCLCFPCSVKAGNPNYKKRMVQKKQQNYANRHSPTT